MTLPDSDKLAALLAEYDPDDFTDLDFMVADLARAVLAADRLAKAMGDYAEAGIEYTGSMNMARATARRAMENAHAKMMQVFAEYREIRGMK